jgi:PadR family transcriptional regulator, regulatory protein AphA
MSLRHALLGLLREHPASGYDLMQIFKLSLNNTWPATQSQVYTELARLTEAGLLSVSEQGPRGRKEYALTDAGLAELRHWMLEVDPELHPRSEGLLRIFLLGAVSREESEGYLSWLAEQSGREVATLEAVAATSADWPDTDLAEYSRLALEYGRRLWVMTQEWADWAAGQVAARGQRSQAQPPPLPQSAPESAPQSRPGAGEPGGGTGDAAQGAAGEVEE